MTTSTALAVVLALLVLMNVWVHLGPRRAHVVTAPAAALLLLAVARAAGLSWAELGLSRSDLLPGLLWGALAAAVTAASYLVAGAVPRLRPAFLDTRYRIPVRSAVLMGLVTIPLATVLFEELAFRSVLWGLLEHEHGAVTATAVSSVLFGLWHVLPALDLLRSSTALQRGGRQGARAAATVLGTVLFTALAGVVFAELRRRSGSVIAPIGLHWATNALAVVAAARAWAVNAPASAADPPERPSS